MVLTVSGWLYSCPVTIKGVLNMANVTAIKNKNGDIVSYRIKVYRGKDANGKQLKPYSMNWRVPPTYKKQTAIDKALQKVVSEFEAKCREGKISVDKRTFAQYADYFIELNKPNWKPTTLNFYNRLMPMIRSEIGGIKLSALSAQDLNLFYLKLRTADVKADSKATAKNALIEKRESMKVKKKDIVSGTGLCDNTIRVCFQKKHIAVKSAVCIADYFGMSLSDAFDVSTSGEGLSTKYIRHYHNFIHCILEQAVKEEIISRNVANNATVPKMEKHEAEFFELEQIEKMSSVLSDEPLKYQVAFHLLLNTGIRRGELIGLRWGDIDFDSSKVHIVNNVVYTEETGLIEQTTKGGEGRFIKYPAELTPILKRYQLEQRTECILRFSHIGNQIEKRKQIDSYNKDGYLFIQDNGKVMTPSALNHWLIRFSDKVGFRVHPHKFRHTHASLLLHGGADNASVSKRLGHKQVSTTQNIYSHCFEKSDEGCADIMSATVWKKSG